MWQFAKSLLLKAFFQHVSILFIADIHRAQDELPQLAGDGVPLLARYTTVIQTSLFNILTTLPLQT